MALDTNVFDKLKTFEDYNRADQEFQMRKAIAAASVAGSNIDAQTKANVYATQVLSAASATGDQNAYDNAKRTLAGQGIDVSTWAPDVASGAQQAQAARLAQSPLGSLLNAGLKAESNTIAGTQAMGSTGAGATVSPLSTAILGGGVPGLNININAPKPAAPANANAPSAGNEPVNNPGNLRPIGATTGFMQYNTPQDGFDAMRADLTAKINGSPAMGGKPPTLANIITAYAPPSENDTASYIAATSKRTGISPDQVLTQADVDKLLPVMVRQEGNASMLPAAGQSTIAQSGRFVPPTQNQGETNQAYQQRVQTAYEAWKTDPSVVAQQAKAQETGKDQAAADKAAKAASANYDQVVATINGIKDLANSTAGLPQDRVIPAGGQAWLSQNIGGTKVGSFLGYGDQQEANNYNAFNKLNEAQTIGAIKELASTGQIRMTRTLENILNSGYLVDPGASKDSKLQQANIILKELENSKIAAQNVNTQMNGGQSQPMVAMPTSNAQQAQPSAGVPAGIKFLGFK